MTFDEFYKGNAKVLMWPLMGLAAGGLLGLVVSVLVSWLFKEWYWEIVATCAFLGWLAFVTMVHMTFIASIPGPLTIGAMLIGHVIGLVAPPGLGILGYAVAHNLGGPMAIIGPVLGVIFGFAIASYLPAALYYVVNREELERLDKDSPDIKRLQAMVDDDNKRAQESMEHYLDHRDRNE